MSTSVQQRTSQDQAYPELTVGALIGNKEGRVLLAKSHKWFDKYTLPGGHIEVGEASEEQSSARSKKRSGSTLYKICDLKEFQKVTPLSRFGLVYYLHPEAE